MKLVPALIILFIILAGNVLANTRIPAPTIVPKEAWGSMKEGEFYNNFPFDPYSQGPIGDPRAITVHHTAIPGGTNPPDPAQDQKKLLDIQHMHVGKGWGDVGYHFLIGSEGTIYQGRPLPWMGTHAPPNSFNIGVNVIGDFHTKEYPNNAQLNSLVRLTTWLADTYDMDPLAKIDIYGQSNLSVVGHRDWGATACPGDRLYALLPSIRDKIRAGLLADAPAYDSRIWAFQYLPDMLLTGRKYQLPLTIRNVGFATWSWLNLVRPESLAPGIVSIDQPSLQEKEDVQPLSNRTWQLTINAPKPGIQRLGVQMLESDRKFGSELAWNARVLAPDDFISQWLVIGPFEAKTPDYAYMNDYFAGTPIDVLDVMDKTSEEAHGYKVAGEYDSGERNYRGEDGERVKENGRYYRGQESFKIFVKGPKGRELVLRRLIDGDTRDQQSVVSLDGRRFSKWVFPGMASYRLWKNLDLIIPASRVAGKDSIAVNVQSTGTVQWGNSSFGYTLLDKAEPLVAPKARGKVGKASWKAWKADTGICDLSTMYPKAESGAAYMAVYVKSPITRYVELRTGYNGFQKAWMNGLLALSGKADHQGYPDTMKGEVLLKKGWNRLLVKVSLEPGMKDLYVRLCGKDGFPIKGLKYALEPVDPAGKEELIALGNG